jgi:hypothetical protein
MCLEQANTLRSNPDRLPALSERENQKSHVPWACNLFMKSIGLPAALCYRMEHIRIFTRKIFAGIVKSVKSALFNTLVEIKGLS